jgi:hypothetical protein
VSVPIFVAALFVVPILGAFDPRNLILAIATEYLAFRGAFSPTQVIAIAPGAAFAVLAIICATLIAIATLVSTRRTSYV